MFLNTGSGGMNICVVKLTFNMVSVRGQQHSFSTHKRVFLWNCQSFWDRKCLDLRGTRTPNLRIHAECSNLLSYQGQTLSLYYYSICHISIESKHCGMQSWSIHLPRCHTYASVNRVSIGSDNGLSHFQPQNIIWTNARLLSTRPLGTNFQKIGMKNT